jgi:hypothetical protein
LNSVFLMAHAVGVKPPPKWLTWNSWSFPPNGFTCVTECLVGHCAARVISRWKLTCSQTTLEPMTSYMAFEYKCICSIPSYVHVCTYVWMYDQFAHHVRPAWHYCLWSRLFITLLT